MSDAVQAEAEGKRTTTIEWRDLTPFEIPLYRDDWPFDAVVAAEGQNWPTFLSHMLPQRALAEFRAGRPTQADAMDLLSTIADALGFADAGE